MCIICVGHYTDSRHGSLVSFRFAYRRIFLRLFESLDSAFDRASHLQFGFSHSCNDDTRKREREREIEERYNG